MKKINAALAGFSSLPNLITVCRLLLVPVVISMIANERWGEALVIFLIAGLSDAIDGWLAKTYDLRTLFGAFLDPIADKTLLVSIYISLAIVHAIPVTLVIIVVFRDIMIMGAVVMSWILEKPVEIKPIYLSKLNTAAQIIYAASIVAAKAFGWPSETWPLIGAYVVGALTIASAAAYLGPWIKHMTK